MRTIIGFLLLTTTSISFSQTTRIEEYCEDLRHANRFTDEWRERCIANMLVQEKYRKKREDDAESTALNSKTKWILELGDLLIAHKKATTADERLTLVAKVEALCARTGTSCDGFVNGPDWERIKKAP